MAGQANSQHKAACCKRACQEGPPTDVPNAGRRIIVNRCCHSVFAACLGAAACMTCPALALAALWNVQRTSPSLKRVISGGSSPSIVMMDLEQWPIGSNPGGFPNRG